MGSGLVSTRGDSVRVYKVAVVSPMTGNPDLFAGKGFRG